MNNENIKGMEDAYSLIQQANKDMISLWLEHTFLGWQWWLGVSLAIVLGFLKGHILKNCKNKKSALFYNRITEEVQKIYNLEYGDYI